jgi:hypothetical protein
VHSVGFLCITQQCTVQTSNYVWHNSKFSLATHLSGEEARIPINEWSHSFPSMLNANLTYLLTLWSRVLLKKLTSSQLVKKFPTFYGTQMFITTVTSAHHLSLSSTHCKYAGSECSPLSCYGLQFKYPTQTGLHRYKICISKFVQCIHKQL